MIFFNLLAQLHKECMNISQIWSDHGSKADVEFKFYAVLL